MRKTLTTVEASKVYEQMGLGHVAPNRVRLWAMRYGFGRKLGATWHIDYELWLEFLNKGVVGWSKERAMERMANKSRITLWESLRPKRKR